MGLHSTLFGPVKFAYLPQHLGEREITGGNGMVEMGTFVAILLGNVAGGLLIGLPQVGATWVAVACVAVAVLGRIVVQFVPPTPATDPTLKINPKPVHRDLAQPQARATENIVVFRSLLGISWMWFFGAVFLSQFPAFAKDVLHGNEQVASLPARGVLGGHRRRLAAVRGAVEAPCGDRPRAAGRDRDDGVLGRPVLRRDRAGAAAGGRVASYTLGAFLAQPAHWRVICWTWRCWRGSAGLYSVPMYALIQLRAPKSHRARIIAANNILNALFMIASSLIAGAMLGAGATIAQVFLATGLANALVAGYIFLLVPEYLLRFLAFVLTRFVYRLKLTGDEHIPTEGAAIVRRQPRQLRRRDRAGPPRARDPSAS